MTRRMRLLLVSVVLLGLCPSARAFELSHYMAGMPNADDFFLPPAEAGQFIYAQYNMYYGTNTIRNANGDKVRKVSKTIAGPLGEPRTVEVDLDFSLDAFYLVPVMMWAPNFTILGARFGAFAALPVGNPSIAADLNTARGRLDRSVDDSTWDVGDLYVQPLWLMRSFPHVDVAFSYGFDAPTGKYEGGATDNVGLGFWEHQIQNSVRVHIDEEKTFSLVLASTFEIGQNKEDADVIPGAHWTLNWGVRKNFLDNWAQVAVLGLDSFQISDDAGSDTASGGQSHLDQVHAAGLQLGIPKLGLAVKYLHEYGARDRFEGQVATIFFALPLEVIAEKLGM